MTCLTLNRHQSLMVGRKKANPTSKLPGDISRSIRAIFFPNLFSFCLRSLLVSLSVLYCSLFLFTLRLSVSHFLNCFLFFFALKKLVDVPLISTVENKTVAKNEKFEKTVSTTPNHFHLEKTIIICSAQTHKHNSSRFLALMFWR